MIDKVIEDLRSKKKRSASAWRMFNLIALAYLRQQLRLFLLNHISLNELEKCSPAVLAAFFCLRTTFSKISSRVLLALAKSSSTNPPVFLRSPLLGLQRVPPITLGTLTPRPVIESRRMHLPGVMHLKPVLDSSRGQPRISIPWLLVIVLGYSPQDSIPCLGIDNS